MGLSALVYQKFTKPNPGNNNENYEDILKKLKDAQDKAKKDLLSGKTSDKVDLKNGKNTEEAIMKFAEATEKEQKKALEELFKNLAEQVTNVFKNHSNSSSENAQLAKDQIPATNTDGTSQTEKTQTDKTYEAVGGTTPLWSEEDKKDPIYERYNKQSDEFKSIVMSGYLKNKDKVASFKDYVSSVFKNKDALGEGIKNAGNYNKPTNPTVPPLFDAGAKIKQLETQLASMQEAYEKLQAKGVEPKELKEQIDKAQTELDKLRDSIANAPQPQDIAKPVAGGTSQTENPQTPVINIVTSQSENPQTPVINIATSLTEIPQTPVINIATSLTEIPETPVINAEDTSLLENHQTPDIDTDGIELLGGKDVSEQLENKKKMEETIKSELFNFNKPSKIKQLAIQLASMQESYEKLQAKGIEPKGLKEQIDKVQAELDKLRAKNN